MSGETTVRLAKEADSELFVRLLHSFMEEVRSEHECWAQFAIPDGDKLRSMFLHSIRNPGELRVFVVEADGMAIGVVNTWTVFSVWAEGKALIIDDLYLAEESRGRGAGTAVMKGLEDWARREGYTRMQLLAMHDNQKAQRLYRSSGFAEEDMVFFMKRLA